MGLHLVRVTKNESVSKDSLNAYADYIRDIASDLGYDVSEVEVETTLRRGIIGFLRDGLIRPFFKTLRMKSNDVTHYTFEGLGLFIPFCRAKRIVTFHHYVYRTENNPFRWYVLWRISSSLAVRFADVILAVSEQTKTEIIERMHVNPEKIRVMSSAPDPIFKVDPDVRKENLIGSMGTLCERKNFSATLRALSQLVSRPGFEDYSLRICGKGPLKEHLVAEAEELGIGGRVEFVCDLSTEELCQMYNSCSLVFNTSLHEGVGFLTIESQLCGTPVLYLRDAKIPEAVTVAAIPCVDEKDIADRSVELLSDSELYDFVVEKGLEFSKEYARGCDRSTIELYESLRDQ